MNKLGIISIIITFIIIGSIIIFHIKNVARFDFKTFMYDFKSRLDEKEEKGEIDSETYSKISREFEELLGRYDESSYLSNSFYSIGSLLVMFFSVIAMIPSAILQFNKDKLCKNYAVTFLSVFSLALMYFYFKFAFESEYKVNLTDDYIYIYDDTFNKEIKDNLDFMYKRKIYLIVCVFLAAIGMITLCIFAIIDNKNKKNKIPEQLLIQPNNNQDNSNI